MVETAEVEEVYEAYEFLLELVDVRRKEKGAGKLEGAKRG